MCAVDYNTNANFVVVVIFMCVFVVVVVFAVVCFVFRP